MRKRKSWQQWLLRTARKLSETGIYQLQKVEVSGEKIVITPLGEKFTRQETVYIEQLCEYFLNVSRTPGIGFQLVRLNPKSRHRFRDDW